MLSFLSQIVGALKWIADNIYNVVHNAIVDCINGFFLAIHDFVVILARVLPSMSDAPAVGGGQWAGWLNWFYPVGELLTGLGVVVGLYAIFLGVRSMLKLVRAF